VSTRDAIADPGTEYTWLVEISNDGDTWWPESHPVDGSDSGGIEAAHRPDELARTVLARRFAALHDDERYAWEELWFRATVWDHAAASAWAGPHQPPYLPEKSNATPDTYGQYLQAHHAQPYAVEVRVPRQVRDGVRPAHTQATSPEPATDQSTR
jgi:hypothetical protein